MLVRPQLVAALLIVSSILGIVNFAVHPVFSQNYPPTATMSLGSMTTGYNQTVTVVKTYQTTGFTTSSSLYTQIMVAFVTSTTFFTYVQVSFTSATSTFAYPAPSIRLKPDAKPQAQSSGISATSRFPEYGESSSLIVVVLIIVFGLLKHIREVEDASSRAKNSVC